MVIKSVNLETVCGITSTIPDNIYREVAFAGKSNVGKSSLINALMNRKSLARISSQPGKTQTINFYNVNECMYLVDLPGYGYANASVEIKAKWGQMIENYLHQSKQLAAVFLLIDIRHNPSENDKIMYDWILNQGYQPVIIATKLDKIKKSQVEKHIKAIKEGLGTLPETIVIPFSSETKQGREEIWKLIDSFVLSPEQLEQMEQKEEQKQKKQQCDNNPKDSRPDTALSSGDGTQRETLDKPAKKERWKKSGHPVAKKTLKKTQAKKSAKKNEKKRK